MDFHIYLDAMRNLLSYVVSFKVSNLNKSQIKDKIDKNTLEPNSRANLLKKWSAVEHGLSDISKDRRKNVGLPVLSDKPW